MKFLAGCFRFFVVMFAVTVTAGFVRYKWSNIQPTKTFPTPLPTPSPNGFDLYLKAAQSIEPGNAPVWENYDRNAFRLSAAEKATRYSLQRRRAWLARNSAGFALMRQAMAAQTRHPDTRGKLISSIKYGKLRELARYKIVESKSLQEEKKWRAAADARLDIVEMGGDVMRGGGLIAGLVGIACEAIALNEFEPLVSHLNATQCRELNARLGRLIASRPLFSEILTEEKYSSQTTLLNTWSQADANKRPLAFPSTWGFFSSLLTSRRSALEGMDKSMNAFIAQADKPLGLRQPVAQPNQFFDIFSAILYPANERSLFNSTRSLGGPKALQLRLSLRAYRLDKGTYPTALKELVPGYLKELPVDPYGSGQTWNYKRQGDSYRAWSIGPDGKDNDGKPILPKRRQKRVVIWTDSIGDVVVTP